MAVRTPFNRRRSGNAKPSANRAQDVRESDTRVGTGKEGAVRLPHEHDESADSQKSPPRAEIEQAGRDLKRGLQDTDRGPVSDATYRKLKDSTD